MLPKLTRPESRIDPNCSYCKGAGWSGSGSRGDPIEACHICKPQCTCDYALDRPKGSNRCLCRTSLKDIAHLVWELEAEKEPQPLRASRLSQDFRHLRVEDFKPTTCDECGGKVKMLSIRGQQRLVTLEGVQRLLDVPFDLLAPKCEKCGETYFGPHDSEAADVACIAGFAVRAKQ